MLYQLTSSPSRRHRHRTRRNRRVESRLALQTLAHPPTAKTEKEKTNIRGFFSRIRVLCLTLSPLHHRPHVVPRRSWICGPTPANKGRERARRPCFPTKRAITSSAGSSPPWWASSSIAHAKMDCAATYPRDGLPKHCRRNAPGLRYRMKASRLV